MQTRRDQKVLYIVEYSWSFCKRQLSCCGPSREDTGNAAPFRAPMSAARRVNRDPDAKLHIIPGRFGGTPPLVQQDRGDERGNKCRNDREQRPCEQREGDGSAVTRGGCPLMHVR